MSYHIVSIDAYTCRLSCEYGQLRCVDEIGEKRIPLEDVASIIVSSFKAEISSNLLTEVARKGISFILCDSYRPVSLVLPVDRASDTNTLRNLASMSAQLKRRLWEKTLDAKCHNQAWLAQRWNAFHPKIKEIEEVAHSRRTNREADTARLFWQIFGDTYAEDFRRGRLEEGFNHLFNYAYAVLLSSILQKLLGMGLDPTFGIFHQPREHSAPLAYDLMEPFRPAFDANVVRWIDKGRATRQSDGEIQKITKEYRHHIADTLNARTEYGEGNYKLQTIIEKVCRTFRKAVISQQSGIYEPWKISIIKWAG